MGVGGNFWDVLKPYGKQEGHDFLRDKRVAVDLSFWVVQHETALRKKSGRPPRNPHLRLTFFRTLNLFSKFGAFPVFVVDGTPSPLKSKARILRFFQASWIDRSSLSLPEEGVSLERNRVFNKCVRECVELLKLLGMPVLEAKGEAEGLCAQLNKDGYVDACITADSDAFLFGAKKSPFRRSHATVCFFFFLFFIRWCLGLRSTKSTGRPVIAHKLLAPGKPIHQGLGRWAHTSVVKNVLGAQARRGASPLPCFAKDVHLVKGASQALALIDASGDEPFECYHMSDIEAGLGLKRNHLITISLLVGNDHDLGGVQGIGIETAIRFTSCYSDEEILNRLIEIGNREGPLSEDVGCMDDLPGSSHGKSPKLRQSHCSFCGHPGSKRSHFTISCSYCLTNDGDGCLEKPMGFKCGCSSCETDRKLKEQKKLENWQIKVCNRIICEPSFPKTEIIDMYLTDDNGYFQVEDGPCLSWERPNEDMVVDFLVCHQNWEPSYIRQKLLVMHSTIYLREAAAKLGGGLLCGQYEFNSIKRVKVRNGVKFFVIKWMKPMKIGGSFAHEITVEQGDLPYDVDEINKMEDNFNESDMPQIYADDKCCFLLTDEHMNLVGSAFPEEVHKFFAEKEVKDSGKRKNGNSTHNGPELATSKSRGVQLNITEFYQSTKVKYQGISGENTLNSSNAGVSSKGKRKDSSLKLTKSARRRLLFG